MVRLLGRLFECGAVTRKLKVVHWSYGARTALAEAEVEYADRTSPAITVAFPVADAEARRMHLPTPLWLPIWTTTPWTLPANLAIAMHPDMEYAVVKAGRTAHYVVAVPLLETFQKDLGVPLHTREIRKGLTFQSLKARHCWLDRESPVLLADYVTADAGTGLVHTAPDHGVDDFNLAHHLGLLQLVGPDGRYTPAVQRPGAGGPQHLRLQPPGGGPAARHRRAAARREAGPQLPPLLAHQDPHLLPGHRAVVHHHGRRAPRQGQDPARTGPGGRGRHPAGCPPRAATASTP